MPGAQDFLADKYHHLRHFKKFEEFAQEMFRRCDTLKDMQGEFEELFAAFKDYRSRIPIYGAILMNQDLTRCLMVQAFGSKSWGFPKGKVNESEDPADCAVREVYEEVGYDCSHLISEWRPAGLALVRRDRAGPGRAGLDRARLGRAGPCLVLRARC